MWFKIRTVISFCIILSLFSCDDTEFNNPAFQADVNYELWRANSFTAFYNEGGDLVIRGTNNTETVVLTLKSDGLGVKRLGPDRGSRADYIDEFDSVFSTAVEPDENVSIYRDLGVVEITDKDESSNTFTGNFYFTAYDSQGQNPVGISNGIFFKVQVKDN